MSYAVPPKFSRSTSMSTIEIEESISTRPRRASADSVSSIGARETRKRFTPTAVQLMMLENMYKHNPHPSRQERETLSKAGVMNLKHVTTWFQNKRQKSAARNHTQVQIQTREQRKALLNATNSSRGGKRTSRSPPPRSASVKSVSPRPTDSGFLQLYPVPASASAPVPAKTAPDVTPPRPSLDRVASRSELPSFPVSPPSPTFSQSTVVMSPPSSQESSFSSFSSISSEASFSPQTPRRGTGIARPIYEIMPASPPTPLFSPAATSRDKEYLEFGLGKRKVTLEWACARRRIAEKEGYAASDDDEDDGILGIGAGGTLMRPPQFKKRQLGRSATWAGDVSGAKQDDEVMRAALALCGLGRGRRSELRF
ncbi:hypothetical protein VNI00_004521 [Paramarasmius palmivorus]|uniref:Homeobox domain-containing protein n=1 Tax=Paramarasmius palmivorus TaxID=297713 RepID=A0AAW0DI76_9AGAR